MAYNIDDFDAQIQCEDEGFDMMTPEERAEYDEILAAEQAEYHDAEDEPDYGGYSPDYGYDDSDEYPF